MLIWVEVTELMHTTEVEGWRITRHLKKLPYKENTYTYVGVAPDGRRVAVDTWGKIKEYIYRSKEKTLL